MTQLDLMELFSASVGIEGLHYLLEWNGLIGLRADEQGWGIGLAGDFNLV